MHSITLSWVDEHAVSSAGDVDSVINRSASILVKRGENFHVKSGMEILAPHFDDAIGWLATNTPYKYLIRRTDNNAVLSIQRNEFN
jgi:hypothetical protein